MEDSTLFEIASSYFQKYMDLTVWPFSYIFYGPRIPEELLTTARSVYAKYDENEEKPILLYDDASYNQKQHDKGFLITNKRIYYHLRYSSKVPQTINSKLLSDI